LTSCQHDHSVKFVNFDAKGGDVDSLLIQFSEGATWN
jgi:hypothetical protein